VLSFRYLGIAILAIIMAIAGNYWWLETPKSVNSVPLATIAQATSPSPGWHPVTIGGGGYVTGFYAHPQEADLLYVRTDNGGYYRWSQSQQQWLPITNSLPRDDDWDSDRNSGGEDLALDPQNPDLVYIAVGKYADRLGTVYKSVDRGATWQDSNLAVRMGGNEDKRWAGNRLVVSPFDSNLLFFGSRQNGLWRSLDAGIHWHRLDEFPQPLDNSIGVLAIAFDPQRKDLVYASIYEDGVYKSPDRGETWQKLVASPAKVMQMKVARDGILYATNSESPQVSKYLEGQWVDITPTGFVHQIFNGLSLHPQDTDTLIISEGEKGQAGIYYSENGGKNWVKKKASLNNTIPWLADEFFNDHPSAIAFDSVNPQRVWLTDWFGVWRTDKINEQTLKWTNQVTGIEQTVVFTLTSPPKGTILLSGIADQDGFYHHNLQQNPQKRMGFEDRKHLLSDLNAFSDRHLTNYFQDTLHIAYCQKLPQNLVRLGGQRWRDLSLGVTSDDGGLSWQPWANIPKDRLLMRVAISATNPQHFVVTVSEDQPIVTQDGGNSWRVISGLPNGEKGPWNWNQPLAADGQISDRFYYYDRGKFYRSDDGGLSFKMTVRDLPYSKKHILTTVSENAGEIWLSLDRGGLYHSVNGGKTFSKIEAINRAYLVTIGTPIDDKFPHSIYVYGTLKDSKSGLFTSIDSGANWLQINQMSEIPRSTKVLVASHQQPGLLFAGTDGRGIHYQLIKTSQLNLVK
jgi:xyloglucan-specific exo-beta-1,4-glucanase